MADDSNNCDCSSFKILFEKAECAKALTEAEQVAADKHKVECRACAVWCSQHVELADLTASLPQFDVSEGLTQKILESIDKQSTPGIETSIWPLGLVATLAFFLMVPFDSVQSVMGWGAGLVGLLALQFLMKTANNREQLV